MHRQAGLPYSAVCSIDSKVVEALPDERPRRDRLRRHRDTQPVVPDQESVTQPGMSLTPCTGSQFRIDTNSHLSPRI
ncbi:hypothetical protein CT19431_MP150007 [Cupriavidus taiwanensis]|nr:hypothetical protein CT19431_MP150007 [Cupriavidus taiwanensis]